MLFAGVAVGGKRRSVTAGVGQAASGSNFQSPPPETYPIWLRLSTPDDLALKGRRRSLPTELSLMSDSNTEVFRRNREGDGFDRDPNLSGTGCLGSGTGADCPTF
jgi:hypothetical protein